MSRRPLVLLGILASVVAVYLALESVRPMVPREEEPSLLGIKARDVVAIRVQEGPRQLRAARTGAGWHIDVPPAPPGAGAAVAGFVGTLASLAPVDSFTRSDADRAAFGLQPARARVELTLRGRAEPIVLYLGDYVPTGGSVYGMVSGDPRIYLVGALIGTDLEKLFYHAQASSSPSAPDT